MKKISLISYLHKKGKVARFSVESLRVFKSRASDGVKAAKLSGGKDTVVSMLF